MVMGVRTLEEALKRVDFRCPDWVGELIRKELCELERWVLDYKMLEDCEADHRAEQTRAVRYWGEWKDCDFELQQRKRARGHL